MVNYESSYDLEPDAMLEGGGFVDDAAAELDGELDDVLVSMEDAVQKA